MLPELLAIELSHDDPVPFEMVPVVPDPKGTPCMRLFRDRVMIDVIHDGNCIPEKFLMNRDEPGNHQILTDNYCRERDWGAELLASLLASALHLQGYYRVNIARTLLDFGRFPGITDKSADHMTRFAINYPFSKWLLFDQKKEVLEDYYDKISSGMDAAIRHKLVKIAIHTYDEHNPSASRRPAISIVTRSHGHQRGLEIPVGMFDSLVPDELAEFTADRILASRIALTLEESAIPAAQNYPYSLPEGSVEVRSQVWYFFRYVQECYEAATPALLQLDGTPTPRDMIWNMLLDTNLRSTQSESLRSYLHMFRKPPAGLESLFREARVEYEKIASFIRQSQSELIVKYRNSMERPSSLLIEIRKDLIGTFNGDKLDQLQLDDAQLIARTIAAAIQTYLMNDRLAKATALEQRDRRYY